MADWYIWSGATGAADGTSWANAFVNLTSISTKAVGDRFFVAHDHVQTQATALTITAPGTDVSPSRIYCADRAGSVPPVAADLRATAQVNTTVASNIIISGSISECYGIIFSAGLPSGAASYNLNQAGYRIQRFVNCTFKLSSSSSSYMNIGFGTGGCSDIFENCSFQFGNVNQRMYAISGRTILRGGGLIGAVFPSALLWWQSSGGHWFVEGFDLSGITTGKSVCNNNGSAPVMNAVIKDCKLGVGGILCTSPTGGYGQVEAYMMRCDSADTNYRCEKVNFCGVQTAETTIVRSGGASDGTTPMSWKIVTTANSKPEMPFEAMAITAWNEIVGSSRTLTVQGIWDGGAVPTNEDVWVEVVYLGTSGLPHGSKATSMRGILATPANCPAGSGTWGGSTTSFALAVTFTPQEKGFVSVYVMCAKPSTTFYIDPKPVLT